MVSTRAADRREAEIERKKAAERKPSGIKKLKLKVSTPKSSPVGKRSKSVYGPRCRLFETEIAAAAAKRRQLAEAALGLLEGPSRPPRSEAEVAAAAAEQRELEKEKPSGIKLKLRFSSPKSEPAREPFRPQFGGLRMPPTEAELAAAREAEERYPEEMRELAKLVGRELLKYNPTR